MTDSVENPTAGPGSTPEAEKPAAAGSPAEKVRRRLTPGKGTRHTIGVLVLVTAVLGIVALIVTGILGHRTAYFEQRNLRELDRIAAELIETKRNLAQTAALHFVPRQLHFSLSPRFECLAATTEVTGARQQPITIAYYFTDTIGTDEIGRWYAEQTSVRTTAAARRPPSLASRPLPGNFCGYQRPRGLPFPPETVVLDDGRITVERTARLTSLIWPMTSPDRNARADLSLCLDEPGARTAAAPTGGARAFIRNCFVEAALEDLGDAAISHRDPNELRRLVTLSLGAAIQSNTIRINVATGTDAIDLDSALEFFDAIRIIGSNRNDHDRPVMLHQAGRVPAAIEGGDSDEVLSALARLAGTAAPRPAGVQAGPPGTVRDREADLLGESRIVWTRDLILFQRTYPRLAGLDCRPCRIVGIVQRSKFNETVRKIDGVQATIFLLSVLTLIGLIPLLQLKLRRRLDAIGRAGQYLIWFSLTLLAASASVAVLALWSSSASRNAGASYARSAMEGISREFNDELSRTLPLIGRIGAQLGPSHVLYPAPETLPRANDLTAQANMLDELSQMPAVATLAVNEKEGRTSIIEGVFYVRGDGFLDLRTSRFSATRFPGFGTDLGSRPYFNRARNRNYDRIDLPECPDANRGTRFILDRVFALTDGSPRMVWLLPAQGGCVRDGMRGQGISTLAEGAGHGDDRQTYYEPTNREYLLASGTLRTFLRTSLAPGFHYAVISPHRPASDANVLFHSRPGAALVERFQNELDDPERFDTLIAQALAPGSAGNGEACRYSPPDQGGLRMETNYRARPARLTVTRLHPCMDWVLVIIEDRNDAGFAIWRAVTFGYAIWFLGALAIGLGLLFGHLRSSPSLDRRPGLSLWPRKRLGSFTPPRIARKADLERRLVMGAEKRDRHIWWVLAAGLIGIPAAEGASRILLAFAAATTAFLARAYFAGMTTEDDGNARRSARWTIALALLLLILAVVVFVQAIHDESDFRNLLQQRTQGFDFSLGRVALFVIAAAVLFLCQLAAIAHAGDNVSATAAEEDGWWRRLKEWLAVRVPGWPAPARWPVQAARWVKNRLWDLDIGWMAMLIVLGALPAAAGFLDSYDQDRFLLAARADQLGREAREQRRETIEGINLGRFAKLPRQLLAQIVDQPLPSPAPTLGRSSFDYCDSVSCLAIFYLDLRDQALEFSDFAPFRMGFGTDGALTAAHGFSRSMVLPFLAGLPLAALILALVFFRQQYFHRPPLLSPGKDPGFDPPLSLTRSQFISEALLRAAAGEDPTLPLRPAGGTRHLILGIGMDLREEWAEGRQLVNTPGIEWIDLLDLPEAAQPACPAEQDAAAQAAAAATAEETAAAAAPVAVGEPDPEAVQPPRANALVIANLDLALQVPDGGKTADRAFEVIKQVSDAWTAPGQGGHVFVLADIDPLDRIAALWELQDREQKTSLVKSWRWAELIQDFTLFPIRDDPLPEQEEERPRVLRTICEEMAMLDIGVAREFRDRLVEKLENRQPPRDAPADAERVVSFITEHMGNHYQKLWASSSDEERVMLYRIARDCHLKMHDSRGLRSLLARGLLIRVPEYRLMNRSFTRYVCRVGATSEIQRSAERVDGLDRIWPLIRYPLVAAAGSGVLLLQFLAPAASSGAVGALPALLTLIPALLGKWFQGRAGTT